MTRQIQLHKSTVNRNNFLQPPPSPQMKWQWKYSHIKSSVVDVVSLVKMMPSFNKKNEEAGDYKWQVTNEFMFLKKSRLKYAVDICVNWLLNTPPTLTLRSKLESKPNTLAPHMPIFIVNQDLFQYKQKITFAISQLKWMFCDQKHPMMTTQPGSIGKMISKHFSFFLLHLF